MYLTHVWVGDPVNKCDFATKPACRFFQPSEITANRLQRHPLTRLDVLRFIDLTHASGVYKSDNPESPLDQISNLKQLSSQDFSQNRCLEEIWVCFIRGYHSKDVLPHYR